MMKLLARCAFLLVTVLWGSFYAAAKGALAHSDPIIFTFFEALTLVPLALVLLFMHRKRLTLALLKRGVLLGSCLCIATLTITVSENFTSATTTAFFPSTGGIFAAVIMATVFRRSLGKAVWIAGGLSGVGILLMFRGSLNGTELRGEVIALLGALLFTVYLFLVEQDAHHQDQPFWALLGVEHLSFALWMTLFALLFGDWHHFHPVLAHDLPVVLYVALACTFLPVVLTHFAHRFLDPLETGFISILEPLWGILIAHLALGEVVPLSMYIGDGFILMGAVVQQAASGKALAVAQILMVLLLQRMKNTNTTLKQWGHLGTLAAAQITNNSLFLVIRLNIFLENVQGDDAWKAYLIALYGNRRRTFQALSQAILRFPRVSFQYFYHTYSLFVIVFSFLPSSSQFRQRVFFASQDLPFTLFGWHLWKRRHDDAYQRWFQNHIYAYLFSGTGIDFSWLVASRQPSHHCVQTRRVHTLQFPQHARGHLTGIWCTAPPGRL
jgi:drug/metabolite transporter (DMT)-like permease